MNLTRIVIHEIIKQPLVNSASSFLSDSLLPINRNTLSLAQNLNNSFSKDSNSYGNFRITENNFYNEFQIHQTTNTDASFLLFSRNVITALTATIGTIFLAKGGFFIFCEYDVNSVQFIGVYLVRDVEGILFNKDNTNHTFQINSVRYLDTNKLAMGGRVHIAKLTDGDNNHIALTKSNQTDISEYFIQWIGTTRPESNSDFTNKLFQIVSSIPLPIDPTTSEQYDLNEFREVAYNLIKASPDKVINLRTLSTSLFQDETTIINYAENNGYELDHDFRYDGRTLNRFRRISANRDGIRLSFARGDLDTKVTVSSSELGVVTIHSRSLADSIREQIDLR